MGPTPKIWRDSQCTNLKNLDASNNLEDCKRECLVAHGCNAINYANTGGCALRKCPIPVPVPSNMYSGFNGYYFNGNTEGQLRLLFYILYVCKVNINKDCCGLMLYYLFRSLKMKQHHAKLCDNMDNTEYRNGRRLDQKRSGTDTHATGHQKNKKIFKI